MAYTYVLRSLKDGRFYYGSTGNIEKRLRAHNEGRVRSTKARRPLVLQYCEQFRTMQEARERERFFKRIEGHGWLKQHGIVTTSSA